jgi:predicted small integral membrane protein
MYWVPVTLIIFKIAVLGVGMFFAIKWHYDQEKNTAKRGVLRLAGTAAAIFVPSLLGVMLVTFALTRMLGLDLSIP